LQWPAIQSESRGRGGACDHTEHSVASLEGDRKWLRHLNLSKSS
jgi:hypothetical protein